MVTATATPNNGSSNKKNDDEKEEMISITARENEELNLLRDSGREAKKKELQLSRFWSS